MCVFNLTRQSFLSLGVGVLPARFGRLGRLIGSRRRNWHEGLWLVPCHMIHTVGRLHPVDVVYLDEQLRVLHVIERLVPYRLAPLRRRTHSVLELPERTVYWSGTRAGDQLMICPPSGLAEQWARMDGERVAG